MTGPDGPDPTQQSELAALEAQLREALQHQRAAVERVQETQAEVEALLRRARRLLAESPPRPDGTPAV